MLPLDIPRGNATGIMYTLLVESVKEEIFDAIFVFCRLFYLNFEPNIFLPKIIIIHMNISRKTHWTEHIPPSSFHRFRASRIQRVLDQVVKNRTYYVTKCILYVAVKIAKTYRQERDFEKL